MFSKACEYGLKAAIFIAEQSQQNERVSLKEISQAISSPQAFTSKILQNLVKNHIVESLKGSRGGFEINKEELKLIKLSQIVLAIDGDSIYKGCGLGLKECNTKKPCPVHNSFIVIREELKLMLETTSIYELTCGLKDGTTFLTR